MAASMDGRVGVLVSGSGTNLQALLDDPSVGPHVVLVVADRPKIAALDRAERAGVTPVVIEPADHATRQAFDVAVAAALAGAGVDVLVSAGWMRLLGRPVLDRYEGRWLNVHPALLPSFTGMHGIADALAYGVKVTGVTVHLVDDGTDTGPVVAQEAVPVRAGDDHDSLAERVHAVEHRLLPLAVRALREGRLVVDGRTVSIREG